MLSVSTLLKDIPSIEMCLGAQPYYNTIHTEEQMKSKFLHSAYQINENYVRDNGEKHFTKYVWLTKCLISGWIIVRIFLHKTR